MHFVILCPLEQLAAQMGDEQYLCMVETSSSPARQQQGSRQEDVSTRWACAGRGFLWLQILLTTRSAHPPTPTGSLGLCRLRRQLHPLVGQLSLAPGSVSTPLIFWRYILWTFCPDQLPSSLACTIDTERAAHPCLTQAGQCVCIPDWHLQAQGKSLVFACSHPWLLLSCLHYLMQPETIILPLLDCFFLCFWPSWDLLTWNLQWY